MVYQFLYIQISGIAFCRENHQMAFSVRLKVTNPPILHTIGLNDLFKCDVLHLAPSLEDISATQFHKPASPLIYQISTCVSKTFFGEVLNALTRERPL